MIIHKLLLNPLIYSQTAKTPHSLLSPRNEGRQLRLKASQSSQCQTFPQRMSTLCNKRDRSEASVDKDAMPPTWPDKAVQPRSPILGTPGSDNHLGFRVLLSTVVLSDEVFLALGLGGVMVGRASRCSCLRDLGIGLRYGYDRHLKGLMFLC